MQAAGAAGVSHTVRLCSRDTTACNLIAAGARNCSINVLVLFFFLCQIAIAGSESVYR